jgi:alanine racemase
MEASPDMALVAAMTHFATADEDLEFVEHQLAAFREFAEQMRRLEPGIVVHAANSAASMKMICFFISLSPFA